MILIRSKKQNEYFATFLNYNRRLKMPIPFKRFPKLKPQNYSVARDKIKSGDILLCSGNSLISQMIKRATKGTWSHVGFVIRFYDIDRIMVMESVESIGVRTVPLSHYVNNYNGQKKGYNGKILIARHTDFEKKINRDKMRTMSKFAVDFLGYPYDNDEIIKIIGRIMASKIGMHSTHFTRDREYICSEYTYECFNAIGIKFKYDKRGFIAPVDFAKNEKVSSVLALETMP